MILYIDILEGDIRELRDAHDAFALTRVGAENHIRRIAEMTENWKATAQQFGISPEAADAMRRAFDGPNRQRALAMGEGRVTGNQ